MLNFCGRLWGVTGSQMVVVMKFIHLCVGIFVIFAAIWAFIEKGDDLEDNTVIAALYTM
jgi:hypothetical protein